MGDLLELSARIIDSGFADQPVNRVTNQLSEIADGLAMVESFSHTVAMRTADGIVAFDASGVHTGAAVVEAVRGWSDAPITHLVYTHGHADHVGGSREFAADADRRDRPRPRVVGHENVARRFDRYDLTNDWNRLINARQFGGIRGELNMGLGDMRAAGPSSASAQSPRFLPTDTLRPTETFSDRLGLDLGGLQIDLRHDRGETDDHLWAWLPEQRWLVTGDFLIWNFPNAGNPQKVQRWPIEWAAALRTMAALDADLLLPAHGLPIGGRTRIRTVLDTIATALENLVDEVLAMMNAGETLDTIIHTVRVPDDTLAKPYLRPLYDEPEFVVHNIWRQFGGWWDGAPSRLKPSPDAELGAAVADLAGGADAVIARARHAAEAGDLRLACHLADFAGWAAPLDARIHAARAEIYEARRAAEPSLMSKGIFKAAARESQAVVDNA